MKTERRKNDMMNGLSELEIQWLQSVGSRNTRKNYKTGWTKFKEFVGKTAEEILEERKQDLKSEEQFIRRRYERELANFFNDQKEKCDSINTAILMTTAPRSFFSFYEVPLKLKRGKIPQFTISTGEHRLSLEDLKAMFAVADLRGRVIISMGKDMAIRVGDFKKIKIEQVRPLLDQEPPVEFQIITEKETVVARTFLSQETIELLKVYLPTLPQDNEYLFPSVNSCLNEDTMNTILQNLAEKAKIPLNGHLSFKCFRKLFLSTCSNLGISDWHSRIMCGKKVDSSIMAYLNSIDLKADAKKIHNVLSITNHIKKVGNLEEAVGILTMAFAKFVRQALVSGGYGQGLGLLIDFNKLSDKEVLEYYLKMM